MGPQQGFARAIRIALAATLAMAATAIAAHSQPSFLPNASPAIGLGDADKSTSEAATSPDQFRLGNSYIGVQTQKSLQPPEPLRRSDCPRDEDCTDYPGLPKSGAPKSTVKSLRKPFIGLSITTPLRQ
jgi:hypothetical protein